MADTVFTGPIKAGNVLDSDGTGNLAGAGGSSGTKNVGYVMMAQSEVVTQATNVGSAGVYTTGIVIPADSQIVGIDLLVTTAWTGTAKTLGIGTTASATALTTSGAVDGSAKGVVSATPGTDDTCISNWKDVGTTDIQVKLTSTNTGNGVGVLTVRYIQSNSLTA